MHLLPVRVLDVNGSGSYSAVEAGITWATDHGATVLNLSLGGTAPSSGLQAAIQYAVDHGVTVVMAAGNCALAVSGSCPAGNPTMYPAAYSSSISGAIAVGATDSTDAIASFSSHGTYVDLAAPGVGIVSTWGLADSQYARGRRHLVRVAVRGRRGRDPARRVPGGHAGPGTHPARGDGPGPRHRRA